MFDKPLVRQFGVFSQVASFTRRKDVCQSVAPSTDNWNEVVEVGRVWLTAVCALIAKLLSSSRQLRNRVVAVELIAPPCPATNQRGPADFGMILSVLGVSSVLSFAVRRITDASGRRSCLPVSTSALLKVWVGFVFAVKALLSRNERLGIGKISRAGLNRPAFIIGPSPFLFLRGIFARCSRGLLLFGHARYASPHRAEAARLSSRLPLMSFRAKFTEIVLFFGQFHRPILSRNPYRTEVYCG